MVEDLFVGIDVAKQVLDKGFSENCFACYEENKLQFKEAESNQIKAPLYEQVFSWLVKDKNLSVRIHCKGSNHTKVIINRITVKDDVMYIGPECDNFGIYCNIFETPYLYESAIKEALKYI